MVQPGSVGKYGDRYPTTLLPLLHCLENAIENVTISLISSGAVSFSQPWFSHDLLVGKLLLFDMESHDFQHL